MVKAAVRYHNLQPQIVENRRKMMHAADRNKFAQIVDLRKELSTIFKENRTGPVRRFGATFINAPFFLTFCFAMRGMADCIPELPGFSTGGTLWFPDLTDVDPYFVLPITSSALFYFLTVRGAEAVVNLSGAGRLTLKVMTVFIAMSMSNFGAGLQFYLLTNVACSLIISSVLRSRQMRTLFGIPEKLVLPPELLASVDPRQSVQPEATPGHESEVSGGSREDSAQREKEVTHVRPMTLFRRAVAAAKEDAKRKREAGKQDENGSN